MSYDLEWKQIENLPYSDRKQESQELKQELQLFRDSLAQWAPVKKDGSTNDRGRFRSKVHTHNTQFLR